MKQSGIKTEPILILIKKQFTLCQVVALNMETPNNSHRKRSLWICCIWQHPDQILIPLSKLCLTAPLLSDLLLCLMSPTQPYGAALRSLIQPLFCSTVCKSARTSQRPAWCCNAEKDHLFRATNGPFTFSLCLERFSILQVSLSHTTKGERAVMFLPVCMCVCIISEYLMSHWTECYTQHKSKSLLTLSDSFSNIIIIQFKWKQWLNRNVSSIKKNCFSAWTFVLAFPMSPVMQVKP